LRNSFSQTSGVNDLGKVGARVFDPNPQYGEFKSLKDYRAAMTLPHELDHATEVFEYTL
jgi:hypothetical protein